VGESQPQSDSHSFVVRMWCEADIDEAGAQVWRGSVDHVNSGRRSYFTEIEGLMRFIQGQVAAAASCVSPAEGEGSG
jgi:hypothetical protein